MGAPSRVVGWRTNAVIIAIIAISVALYSSGSPPSVFAVAALLVFAYLLGQYFRKKPSITFWRAAYILLFSCWIGLAIFFALSALLVRTGIVQPSVTAVVVFAGGGLAIGGAIGDWVGRRRGYRPPERTL